MKQADSDLSTTILNLISEAESMLTAPPAEGKTPPLATKKKSVI